MRDHDDRVASLPETTEDHHDLCRFPGIEPCRGLVEDDHPWPHGNDTGECQALPLTARE